MDRNAAFGSSAFFAGARTLRTPAPIYRAIVDDFREPRAMARAQLADRQTAEQAERERAAELEIARNHDANVKAERERNARSAWLERLPDADHAALMELAARRAGTASPAMRDIQVRIRVRENCFGYVHTAFKPIGYSHGMMSNNRDASIETAYRAAARRLHPGAVVDDDTLVSTAPDGAYVQIAVWIGDAVDEPAAAIAEGNSGAGLVDRAASLVREAL